MQFTDKTLTVLKNFAAINPSLAFSAGTTIRTMNPHKTVIAIADVDTEFPGEAVVYDMSRFLATLGLYTKPEVEFGKKAFVISEGRRRNTYAYADKSMIISAPEKDPKFPAGDVEVKVEWNDLQAVLKASSVLQLPEVAFVGEEGKVYLRAIDSKNPTADQFGVELGDTADTFTLIIKTENLKLLPQNYEVTLSGKGISRFAGDGVRYYVAIEKDSSYNKGA